MQAWQNSVSGYLKKCKSQFTNSRIKRWDKRWFSIQEDVVLYYHKKSSTHESGKFYLHEVSDAFTLPEEGWFRVMTIGRDFLLDADSRQEAERWVKALTRLKRGKKGFVLSDDDEGGVLSSENEAVKHPVEKKSKGMKRIKKGLSKRLLHRRESKTETFDSHTLVSPESNKAFNAGASPHGWCETDSGFGLSDAPDDDMDSPAPAPRKKKKSVGKVLKRSFVNLRKGKGKKESRRGTVDLPVMHDDDSHNEGGADDDDDDGDDGGGGYYGGHRRAPRGRAGSSGGWVDDSGARDSGTRNAWGDPPKAVKRSARAVSAFNGSDDDDGTPRSAKHSPASGSGKSPYHGSHRGSMTKIFAKGVKKLTRGAEDDDYHHTLSPGGGRGAAGKNAAFHESETETDELGGEFASVSDTLSAIVRRAEQKPTGAAASLAALAAHQSSQSLGTELGADPDDIEGDHSGYEDHLATRKVASPAKKLPTLDSLPSPVHDESDSSARPRGARRQSQPQASRPTHSLATDKNRQGDDDDDDDVMVMVVV
eukprot:Rmarinus@m.8708